MQSEPVIQDNEVMKRWREFRATIDTTIPCVTFSWDEFTIGSYKRSRSDYKRHDFPSVHSTSNETNA